MPTRKELQTFIACMAVSLMTGALTAGASGPAGKLAAAMRGTQASAVLLDWRTGATLAAQGRSIPATPGSAIKPLLLDYALRHHIVTAETQVYCRRDLRVGGRALPCTHPADDPVFNAERALAESCNTWFAEMGRRITGEELERALAETHLAHRDAGGATVVQRQLMVLGLEGVSSSALELARAYRSLLVRSPGDETVVRGLQDAVAYGMSNPAKVPGMSILGKTGTASNPGEPWTHGWFAGALQGQVVLVVYVPHGDGGDAARIAHAFFEQIGERAQSR